MTEKHDLWFQRKPGRPRIYQSPEELENDCLGYFIVTSNRKWIRTEFNGKDAKECHVPTETPFTLTGLFVYLEIDRKTWDLYRGREEFIPVITRIENIIYTQKFEGAAVGAFNANIISRDLGLADKKEIDRKTTKVKFKDAE